jgi:hypothetical protein
VLLFRASSGDHTVIDTATGFDWCDRVQPAHLIYFGEFGVDSARMTGCPALT